MLAITTWPWSSSTSWPFRLILVFFDGRPFRAVRHVRRVVDVTVAVRRVAGREAAQLGRVDLELLGRVVDQRAAEAFLGLAQRDPVLRPLRAGDRRYDGGQIKLEVLREARLDRGVVPQTLLLGVGLDQRDLVVAAAGEPQVLQGHVVDREDRAGGAELGAHVADGRAVGQRHGRDAVAVELDELADHAVLTQHLRDRQYDVGGGRAGRYRAGQLEADDLRDQHADRLAEHRGLGLDAADAPAEHAQSVDHRGVRVGTDAGVGVRLAVADHHGPGQVLDVHLVHDAGARRDDLELVERRLAPAQELVPLLVAPVLQLDVALEGVLAAEDVDDDRVVDDQLGRRQRVDLGRVAPELGDRLAHGGQVDHTRHAGEVLHDHPRRGELDLGVGCRVRVPVAELADVLGGDVRAVLGAQQVLEQHLERVRQRLSALDTRQPEDLVRRSVDLECTLGTEAVDAGHQPAPLSGPVPLTPILPSPRPAPHSSGCP